MSDQQRPDVLARRNQTLIQTVANMGGRLESALKLLSAIAGLSAVPLEAMTLAGAAGKILEIIVRDMEHVEGCSLLLAEPGQNRLMLLVARGQADFWGATEESYNRELSFEAGEGVAGHVFVENRPYFWDSSSADQGLLKEDPRMTTPVSLACLPLSPGDTPIGVLNVSFGVAKPFDHPRQRDLIVLSDVVANIIQDFKLKAELESKTKALQDKISLVESEMYQRRLAEDEIKVLAKFPDENPHPVLRVRTDLTVGYANRASAPLLQAWGSQVGDRLPDYWREPIDLSRSAGSISGFEIEVEGRLWTFMVVPVSDVDAVYLFGQDVTEAKQHEEQLWLMASVFENTIEGIIVTDAQVVIEKVNPAFTAITGYSEAEAVGKTPAFLQSGRHDSAFYEAMWRSLQTEGRWSGHIWNRRKNGEAYAQWMSVAAIWDAEGQTRQYVAVFHDITDIKQKEEKIKYQAEHDPLTGLPNRALFYDRLDMNLARARRNKEMLAVLFLDLDNFKQTNDTLGHAMGDLLLKEVAARLKRCLRTEDTVARVGGDEFLMILPELTQKRQCSEAAGRIIKSISSPFRIQGHDLHVGASIGITIYPMDGEDRETLVKNADLAMYRAKEQGKNNYQLFTPALHARVVLRMDMEYSLRQALSNREFSVEYHPKVRLGDGRVVGMEALVRWLRPELGRLSPEEFIPYAEECGLILPIGEWVLRTACRQTEVWRRSGFPELTISVNLSPRHFVSESLVSVVEGILAETHLPASCLELEITELAVMDKVEQAIDTMNRLAGLGVGLVMDDFGTGYSSLAHLKRFPISALKIDRSFIRHIPERRDDMALAEAIIHLGRSLNMQVVAEGVENQVQLDFLRSLKCDAMQGYLFSPPLSAEEFEKMLVQGRRLSGV
jgi:diguanylate cyclase (GGDEF)-like protein/PAS domain S-box-containing protein